MTTATRTRWAAIGAAVAVTLGAGGVGISQATTDSGDGAVAAFFSIEPCRLADNAAIGADSSITLDGWGVTGDCDLPDDITSLAVNVTAVGATAQTNLRFYAQGDDVPGTANLNPTPGAPPTPNAVTVSVNDTNGQFSVYNRFGTVNVFIDVMGYYDNHTHDDRYYTRDQVDALLGNETDPTSHGINIYDLTPLVPDPFSPAPDTPSWFIEGAWTHVDTAPFEECLYAAVHIPVGTTVTGADVVFDSPAAGEVDVAIDSFPATATAAPLNQQLTGTVSFPDPPVAGRRSIGIDFLQSGAIEADQNYLVLVCTADQFSLFGLDIRVG